MRPPYAVELLEAKREGRPVNLFVYAGRNAWRFAEHRPKGARLVVPDDKPWRAMDFSCVAGLGVTVLARDWQLEEFDAFCRHLVQRGATLVAGLRFTSGDPVVRVESTFYRPAGRSTRAA